MRRHLAHHSIKDGAEMTKLVGSSKKKQWTRNLVPSRCHVLQATMIACSVVSNSETVRWDGTAYLRRWMFFDGVFGCLDGPAFQRGLELGRSGHPCLYARVE